MADPKHPRRFTDEFKRQIVELVNAGKPKAEVMREYDLSKSTVDRWVKAINLWVSPHAAAGNRNAARAEQDHRPGLREQAAPWRSTF